MTAMASSLMTRKRKKMPTPRLNARRASEREAEERRSFSGRLRRAGRWAVEVLSVLGVLGLAVGGCVGVFLLGRELGPLMKEWFVVRQITVEGLNHLTRREVIERLPLKSDTTLYEVNPGWLAERLERHPWVKKASVSLVPLHEVRVTVVERKPAAVVRTSGEYLLTDDEGYVLARLGSKDDPSLPMLSGITGRALVDGTAEARQAVKAGASLAKMMADAVGGRPEVNVAHLSNVVATVHGVTFQFNASSMDQQWQRFLQMRGALRDVALDQDNEQSQHIDLRYMDRVIVRGRG